MQVVTAEPMTCEQVFLFTGKDAWYKFGNLTSRIMNFCANQTIEADEILEHRGYWWGLKKAASKQRNRNWDYVAFLIKHEE